MFVKCTHILFCRQPAFLFSSFGAYQRSLSLNCQEGESFDKTTSHWSEYLMPTADPKPSSLWHYSGQPGILQWTPDRHTPDTVYYQCYTHRYQCLINKLALFISHIPLIPKCSCFHTMDIQCYSFQIPGLENQRSRSLWPIEQKEEVGIKNGCLPHVWKSRCSGRSSRSCLYQSNIETLIETRCFNINIHMDSIHFAIFWAFEDPGGQNIE